MKKTLYFTSENIENKAKKLIKEIDRKQSDFCINKSALLVLDMQDFFLKESSHAFIPSSRAIIANIKRLVEFFYVNQQPVFFTKHLNNKKNAQMMDIWWKELIEKDKIIDELNTDKSFIIEKNQYDAFYNTNLEKILKEKHIEQVVITGVMTHLCCETTARSSFVRGFEVFFIADSTATYNETFHKASLINLSHGFAIPTLTKEIVCQK